MDEPTLHSGIASLEFSDVKSALEKYRRIVLEKSRRSVESCVEECLRSIVLEGLSEEELLQVRMETLCDTFAINGQEQELPECIKQPQDFITHFDELSRICELDGTSKEPKIDVDKYVTTVTDAFPAQDRGLIPVPSFPAEFRELLAYTSAVVGPGLYSYRERKGIAFMQGPPVLVWDDFPPLEELGASIGQSWSWDVAYGWRSGQSGYGWGYVLYCKNEMDERPWAWRYLVTEPEFPGELYDDIPSFLAAYAEKYEGHENLEYY